MNFEGSWYLVQQNALYVVLPHEELVRLPLDSYLILLNVPTRQEAMLEKERLLKRQIEALKQRLDGTP